MSKSLIFGQKPWIIPFGKSRSFALFKTSIFWSKIILFYPEYQKTIFSDLISQKNTNKKNVDFLAKTEDYPLRKMSIFFDFLKRYLSGLKIIRFYPKYQKTIFSDLIIPKNPNEKKFDF